MKKLIVLMSMSMVGLLLAAPTGKGPKPAGPQNGPKKRAPQTAVQKPSRRESRAESRTDALIQRIDDSRSIEELLHLMPRVQSSPNPDVRSAMVSALEDKGRLAAPYLVAFLADRDEDIADEAWSAWTNVVGEMSPRARMREIQAAAGVLQQSVAPHGAPMPVHQGVPPPMQATP